MIWLRNRANLGNESSWLVTFSDLILLLLFFLLFGLSWAEQSERPSPAKISAAPALRRSPAAPLIPAVNIAPVLVVSWNPVADVAQLPARALPEARQKAVPEQSSRLAVVRVKPPGDFPEGVLGQPAEAQLVNPEPEAGTADPAGFSALRDAGEAPSTAVTGRDPAAGEIRPMRISLSDSETSRAFFSNISYKGEQPQDLLITLLDTVGFPSSRAEVSPLATQLLREVRAFAARYPKMGIEVSGHTDNVPIHSAKYASNWELASARALAVAHFLMADGSVSPCRVSARGFGEYRPVASNASPEGRARNRRVEIRFYQGGDNSCVEASAREQSRS